MRHSARRLQQGESERVRQPFLLQERRTVRSSTKKRAVCLPGVSAKLACGYHRAQRRCLFALHHRTHSTAREHYANTYTLCIARRICVSSLADSPYTRAGHCIRLQRSSSREAGIAPLCPYSAVSERWAPQQAGGSPCRRRSLPPLALGAGCLQAGAALYTGRCLWRRG